MPVNDRTQCMVFEKPVNINKLIYDREFLIAIQNKFAIDEEVELWKIPREYFGEKEKETLEKNKIRATGIIGSNYHGIFGPTCESESPKWDVCLGFCVLHILPPILCLNFDFPPPRNMEIRDLELIQEFSKLSFSVFNKKMNLFINSSCEYGNLFGDKF